MSTLKLEGIVQYYAGELCSVGPRIGGADLIDALDDHWPYGAGDSRPAVKVYLGVEPVATGPLWAIHGFGGTEVTPPEWPAITVGDFSLMDRLRDLDGRHVLLIVEDA